MQVVKYDTDEFEEFFKTAVLPPDFWVDKAQHVVDVQKFVESHLVCIRTQKEIFRPFYERLIKLKDAINSKTSESEG